MIPKLVAGCLYHSGGIRRSRRFHVGKAEKRNRMAEPGLCPYDTVIKKEALVSS